MYNNDFNGIRNKKTRSFKCILSEPECVVGPSVLAKDACSFCLHDAGCARKKLPDRVLPDEAVRLAPAQSKHNNEVTRVTTGTA